MNVWQVLLLMLVAGAFGGGVGVSIRDDEPSKQVWVKGILIGIGASLLVPLFLRTLSSGLVGDVLEWKDNKTGWEALLVFGGFCLVAAISSKAFIQGLSERILKEARSATREAKAAQQSAEGAAVVAQAALDAQPKNTDWSSAVGKSAKLAAIGKPEFPDVTEGVEKDDPWWGQFGGKDAVPGRKLEASIIPVPGRPDLRAISLIVRSTNAADKLKGYVKFFLHPTFPNSMPIVPVIAGEAHLSLVSWGAFTVGAMADDGRTMLELDLSRHPEADEPWRSR